MSATAEYLVSGMTCEHCVKTVTEELQRIQGVHTVRIDLKPEDKSVISVSSESPVSEEDVAAAVEEAGYELSRE